MEPKQHVSDREPSPSRSRRVAARVVDASAGASGRARRSTALFVTLAVALLSAGTRAQQVDPQRTAAARALYDAAVKAMDAQEYASACPKLEEATRLEPAALGARFTLAECYEGAGRLATAWATFLQVEDAAARAGQEARKKKAQSRAAALEGRLPRLTLRVPDQVKALPGLEILRDGLPVGPAQWGVPIPVDRGRHTLVVSAPGKQQLKRTFHVEADGDEAVLSIPLLRDTPPPPGAVDRGLPPRAAPASGVPLLAPNLNRPRRLEGPLLHVETNGPAPLLTLYRANEDPAFEGSSSFPSPSTKIVCRAPCDQVVRVEHGDEFFFGGKGIAPSSRFRLTGLAGPVTVQVDPGTSAGEAAGLVMLVAGIPLGAAGGIGLPIAASAERKPDGAIPLAGISLGVGVALIVTGALVMTSNRTTYALAP